MAKEYDLTKAQLAEFFHLPVEDAAKKIGLCSSMLKKLCREKNIHRWPHRKLKSIEELIETARLMESYSKPTVIDVETLQKKKEYLIANPDTPYRDIIPKYISNRVKSQFKQMKTTKNLAPTKKIKKNPVKTKKTTVLRFSLVLPSQKYTTDEASCTLASLAKLPERNVSLHQKDISFRQLEADLISEIRYSRISFEFSKRSLLKRTG